MTTAITNFYASVIRSFEPRPTTINRQIMDYIGKYGISKRVSDLITEAIDQYHLSIVDCDSFFVMFSNGEGLTIKVKWTDTIKDVRYYSVIINNREQPEVPEDLLNDLIITELQIP